MQAIKRVPAYHDIDGFRLAECFIASEVRSAINYSPHSDDVFVVTFPKCGTTWALQVVTLIMGRGELPPTTEAYFQATPFLELVGGHYVNSLPRPIAIKTHLPFQLTPFSPDAKYIYVARNPRDCCISFYHHTTYFPGYKFTDGSFDDFFDLFVTGETDFGDYFDHLLSWYEHRDDPNVLFLTYESMKSDRRGSLLTMARFLGERYAAPLEEDTSLVEKILQRSSFEYMKDSVNKAYDEMLSPAPELLDDPSLPLGQKSFMKVNADAAKNGYKSKSTFVRKGEVGEGRRVLTEAQQKRLDDRIAEKTKGSDVMDLWNGHDV